MLKRTLTLCCASLCLPGSGQSFAADGAWGYPEQFVGRVVDASGNPAANATVRLLFSAKIPANPPTTRTDADGRFELPNLPQEKARELARNLMGAPETSLIATTADGSERGIARDVDPRFAQLKNGGDRKNRENAASEIVVQTRPGFVFAGKIVDESGAPIPNATVWVGDLRDPVDVATTNENGDYRVAVDRKTRPWKLIAYKKGLDFVVFSGEISKPNAGDGAPDATRAEEIADAPKRIVLKRRAATIKFVDEFDEPFVGLTVVPSFDLDRFVVPMTPNARPVRLRTRDFGGGMGGTNGLSLDSFNGGPPRFDGNRFEEFARTTDEKGEITLEILPTARANGETSSREPFKFESFEFVELNVNLRRADEERLKPPFELSTERVKSGPNGVGTAPIKIVVRR